MFLSNKIRLSELGFTKPFDRYTPVLGSVLLAQKFERRTFLNQLRLATIPVSVAGLYEVDFHTQLRPVTVAKVHGQLAHA